MSDVNVKIDPIGHKITPEQVKSVVDLADKLVNFAQVLVKLTPNQTDDAAVGFIRAAVDAVKPHAAEQWVADLVDFVVHLFVKHENDPDVIIDVLKAVISR